jgi:hypothetical protein
MEHSIPQEENYQPFERKANHDFADYARLVVRHLYSLSEEIAPVQIQACAVSRRIYKPPHSALPLGAIILDEIAAIEAENHTAGLR